eukprot:33180-Alexandrium_andersonii.AAC.1
MLDFEGVGEVKKEEAGKEDESPDSGGTGTELNVQHNDGTIDAVNGVVNGDIGIICTVIGLVVIMLAM